MFSDQRHLQARLLASNASTLWPPPRLERRRKDLHRRRIMSTFRRNDQTRRLLLTDRNSSERFLRDAGGALVVADVGRLGRGQVLLEGRRHLAVGAQEKSG